MNFEGRSCLSIGVESGIDAIIELLLDFDANMEVYNIYVQNRYIYVDRKKTHHILYKLSELF